MQIYDIHRHYYIWHKSHKKIVLKDFLDYAAKRHRTDLLDVAREIARMFNYHVMEKDEVKQYVYRKALKEKRTLKLPGRMLIIVPDGAIKGKEFWASSSFSYFSYLPGDCTDVNRYQPALN